MEQKRRHQEAAKKARLEQMRAGMMRENEAQLRLKVGRDVGQGGGERRARGVLRAHMMHESRARLRFKVGGAAGVGGERAHGAR